MRERLAVLPDWVAYAVQGLVVGVCMDTTERDDRTSGRSLLFAVGAGVLFAVLMWFVERGGRRRVAAFTAGLSKESRLAVWRAADTGVPPADPMQRELSLRLLHQALSTHLDNRAVNLTIWVILSGLSLILGFTTSWTWFFNCACGAVLIVWTLRRRGTLEKRIASLQRCPVSV